MSVKDYCNCCCHSLHSGKLLCLCICDCNKPESCEFKISGFISKDDEIHKLNKTVECMQEQINDFIRLFTTCDQNLEKIINERLNKLEEITNSIMEDDIKCGRKPYKCPVCDGSGNFLLPPFKDCHGCNGKGTIWG